MENINYPAAGVDGTDGEHPRFTTVQRCNTICAPALTSSMQIGQTCGSLSSVANLVHLKLHEHACPYCPGVAYQTKQSLKTHIELARSLWVAISHCEWPLGVVAAVVALPAVGPSGSRSLCLHICADNCKYELNSLTSKDC